MNTKDIPWHSLPASDAAEYFDADLKIGLSAEAVRRHEKTYGKNVLKKKAGPGFFGKILKQFKSPLVYVLLFAGTLSAVLSEYLDTIVIAVALLINIITGVVQEERASKAFGALNRSRKRSATLIREGRKSVMPSSEAVPGDLAAIEAGMEVPADLRITESKNLKVNEAILTGEWVEVSKDSETRAEETPLAERKNMAFMGTLVSSGYAFGIVVATGKETELGKISEDLMEIEDGDTPIQRNVRQLAVFLFYLVLFSSLAILILGILRDTPLKDILLLSTATAVAVIPEGLPAAVTVVLAIGMERILKKGGLVRNLLAAETLGGTTVILTDKTGTLTQAKMKLSGIWSQKELESGKPDEKENIEILKMAIAASDAFLEKDERGFGEKFKVVGRPVEAALLSAGLERGMSQEEISRGAPREDFLQFSSERGYAASLHAASGKGKRLFLSGKPEVLLEHSKWFYREGRQEGMTGYVRDKFIKIQNEKSLSGERFIAVAYRDVSWVEIPDPSEKKNRDEEEILDKALVFGGLISFADPIRADAAPSIKKVRKAGARVLMVTGDNHGTALSVARKVGIAGEEDGYLSGSDIDKLNDERLKEELYRIKVYARVLPHQKLRIARILKNNNEVVAMTGDGVNDAPALKSADIGVAVGSGTEVAKESSDLVLVENSFSVIVDAIEEGRRIMDNLKKIIAYLLSANFSEIFVIGGALVLGTALPILPTQILWINVLEGGLMNFAYAFEPAEEGIMKRSPRNIRAKTILTPELKKLIVTVSIISGTILVLMYAWLLRLGVETGELRTIIFFALSLDSIIFAFSFKGLSTPLWKINVFSNPYLLLSLSVSLALLALSITLPPLRALLSLVPLSLADVAVISAVALVNLALLELAKYFFFERPARR